MAKTLLIAHRGASLRATENSLRAFRLAAELGADWIELDVQLSSDGEAMVYHDDNLDRLTAETGPLADRSARELASIQIGPTAGDNIPTLAEALTEVGRTRLYVELKSDGGGLRSERNRRLLDRCASLLEGSEQHAVASFDVELVRECLRRGLPAVLIFSELDSARRFSDAERRSLLALSARGDLLEGGAADLAKSTATALWLWTLDDPEAMRRAMALGAHGICSNDVALARSVVDEWWK